MSNSFPGRTHIAPLAITAGNPLNAVTSFGCTFVACMPVEILPGFKMDGKPQHGLLGVMRCVSTFM